MKRSVRCDVCRAPTSRWRPKERISSKGKSITDKVCSPCINAEDEVIAKRNKEGPKGEFYRNRSARRAMR